MSTILAVLLSINIMCAEGVGVNPECIAPDQTPTVDYDPMLGIGHSYWFVRVIDPKFPAYE